MKGQQSFDLCDGELILVLHLTAGEKAHAEVVVVGAAVGRAQHLSGEEQQGQHQLAREHRQQPEAGRAQRGPGEWRIYDEIKT